ncbi:TIR domain-containing protein [Microbacterium sp. HA-8]|uniref:TIR domain-containing protein n=1 Tax=Microbacterium sp. HA-8 TaxID=3234200 RepID=UPI0038F7B658
MTKVSGATKQSLAKLLEDETTHTVLDSLFTRYEVKRLTPNMSSNKLSKATYLVQQLSDRGALPDLVEYLANPHSGLSNSFRRGHAASTDFYRNYDNGFGAKTSAAKPRERAFARPGTTAPPATRTSTTHAKRYIFVVRGRDASAYNALISLLTALDLRVVTWDEATRSAGGGTPHTLDIVRAGIGISDAVIVLMTPDDEGYVKSGFYDATRDDPREARPTGQARQNVVFEAGWAMALNQNGTVLVRVGDVRPLSDIDGLNYVWLTNDIDSRRQLITRLRNCDLEVRDNDDRWRTAGEFPER